MIKDFFDQIRIHEDLTLEERGEKVKALHKAKAFFQATPRWPLFVHIATAVINMGCSAYFHTFQC
jgi:adiponectin receptor